MPSHLKYLQTTWPLYETKADYFMDIANVHLENIAYFAGSY